MQTNVAANFAPPSLEALLVGTQCYAAANALTRLPSVPEYLDSRCGGFPINLSPHGKTIFRHFELFLGKIVSDDEETLTSFVMFTLRSVIQGYDCRAIPHMYLGVSINGGTPIAGWLIRENPIYKLMITRGTPISGHLHLDLRFFEVSW